MSSGSGSGSGGRKFTWGDPNLLKAVDKRRQRPPQQAPLDKVEEVVPKPLVVEEEKEEAWPTPGSGTWSAIVSKGQRGQKVGVAAAKAPETAKVDISKMVELKLDDKKPKKKETSKPFEEVSQGCSTADSAERTRASSPKASAASISTPPETCYSRSAKKEPTLQAALSSPTEQTPPSKAPITSSVDEFPPPVTQAPIRPSRSEQAPPQATVNISSAWGSSGYQGVGRGAWGLGKPMGAWGKPISFSVPVPTPTPATSASMPVAQTIPKPTTPVSQIAQPHASPSTRQSDSWRGFQKPASKDAHKQGPAGRRPPRPNPNFVENQREIQDFVKSRPTIEGQLQTKRGKQGKPIGLLTNHFALESLTTFNLFQYHLDFKPNEERTEVRKKLVLVHDQVLGAYIFDGQSLYSPHRIHLENVYSSHPYTQEKIQITIKFVREVSPVDPVFLQVYNIIFRNIMVSLDLELMGRFYYDPAAKSTIPSRKLEVWPGYITSVRNHENQILLNLEVTHKVVRSDSVLDFINNTMKSVPSHMDYRKAVTRQLLGSVVLTSYSRKNYKIDDIRWDVSPKDEFKMRGGETKSYIDYFKQQYGYIIKDLKQPMLVSHPKKRDYHRGAGNPIFLVPEMCQMTGLSDQMRSDVPLMKDLTGHLIMTPEERLRKTNALITRWYSTPKVLNELKKWDIKLSQQPQRCPGRIVDLEELVVGPALTGLKNYSGKGPTRVKQDRQGEWISVFKHNHMLSTVALKRWAFIFPSGMEAMAQSALDTMRSQARSMGFHMEEPVKYKLRDTRTSSYVNAIDCLYKEKMKTQVQMFLVLLPNTGQETYSAIKRKTFCELGISCQCVVAKTLQTKNLMSVTNRIAIQMNVKLGGEPWTVDIPLKDIMIVGYDVFHSPNKRASSVGAMVASTSTTLARYFTSTHFHKSRNELSANLCSSMTGALYAYKQMNGKAPARIVLYRDGVGDGQLSYIYNTELVQIKEAIKEFYSHEPGPVAKFSFIVVTKRIHTRIFLPDATIPGHVRNPPPGTVVDDVVTLPERYDFFLISQAVNTHGTVSPTSYNVLYDEQGLDVDKMQRLTLKLCHLYFNYTGTIAVPAPCQFAHKLAYITGISLNNRAHEALQNYLYFL